jgi:hypothetical protein
VEHGAANAGYSQTKARICAIDALSDVAGVQSPAAHPLVRAARAAALRTKRGGRRGPSRPIFAAEIPSPPPPTPPAAAGGGAGRRVPARSLRARAATAAHMAALHDGALRYDDMREGQLGDILFFPELVDISVFGSKTDRELAGQTATLPRGGPGAAGLIRNARVGLERLLELPLSALRESGNRLAHSLGTAGRAGPEALASWPAPIPDLSRRLFAAGVQAHGLPLFGRCTTSPRRRTSRRPRRRASSLAWPRRSCGRLGWTPRKWLPTASCAGALWSCSTHRSGARLSRLPCATGTRCLRTRTCSPPRA